MEIAVRCYEGNLVLFKCKPEGMRACELLSLICEKLNVKEKRVVLLRNGLGITNESIIFPGEEVVLSKHRRKSSPNLGLRLWNLTKIATQEESLQSLACDMRIEMHMELMYSAHYGYTKCMADPTRTEAWQRTQRYFPDHTNAVLKRVRALFNELDGLEPSETWEFNWENGYQITPLITARDLNDLHIQFGDGTRYRKILVALRTAIINGQVAKDSRELQLEWVRNESIKKCLLFRRFAAKVGERIYRRRFDFTIPTN
jgi:hypothetical protein